MTGISILPVGITGTGERKDKGFSKDVNSSDTGGFEEELALLLNGWMLPGPGSINTNSAGGNPKEKSSCQQPGINPTDAGLSQAWGQQLLKVLGNISISDHKEEMSTEILKGLWQDYSKQVLNNDGSPETANSTQSSGNFQDKLLTASENSFSGGIDSYQEIITGLLKELSGEIQLPANQAHSTGTPGINPEVQFLKQWLEQELSGSGQPQNQAFPGPTSSGTMESPAIKAPSLTDVAGKTNLADNPAGSSADDIPENVRQEQKAGLNSPVKIQAATMGNGNAAPETGIQEKEIGASVVTEKFSSITGERVPGQDRILQGIVRDKSPGKSDGFTNPAQITAQNVPRIEANPNSADVSSGHDNFPQQNPEGDKQGNSFLLQAEKDTKDGTSSPKSSHDNEQTLLNSSVNVGLINKTKISDANLAEQTHPILRQISTAFREQVLNQSPVVKELSIQLQPAELGKIQIALNWENGQVHLQITASEDGTARILQNHVSELRQSLQDLGVTCGRLDMGMGRESPNQQHYEPRRAFYPGMFKTENDNEPFLGLAYENGLETENYRVNVRA